MWDVPWTCSHSHGRSCLQSHSLDRWLRSPSRSHQERRVTFQELEVEPDPEESEESYPPEPSIMDIETWLDWGACQLGYAMLVDGTYSHPRGGRPTETCPEDPGLLLDSWGQKQGLPRARLYCTPATKYLNWNMFLLDELSYQDVWQQPFLLTVAYARGLQYWAEKLNPPEDPDFCPLVRSVIELRERVKEHVIFTKWDVIQGLGKVNTGATSQWPQTNPTGFWRVDPPLSPCVTMVPLTRLQVDDYNQLSKIPLLWRQLLKLPPLPCLGLKLTRPITPPDRTEEENQYLLVISASIRQLNLETTGVDLGKLVTASPRRGAFQNPHMVAVLSGPARRAISGQGTIVKELEEWCRMRTSCNELTHTHLWAGGWTDDCLWVERLRCHGAVTTEQWFHF